MLNEVGEILAHDAEATREEVHVVEALLKDDLALHNAMSFIIVVHHQNLVWLVLVDVQLGEHLISLDVLCRERKSVRDVRLFVLLCRSQIEQQNLGQVSLRRWTLCRILTLSQHLYIVQGSAKLYCHAPLLDVVGKRHRCNSSKVFSFAPRELCRVLCVVHTRPFLFLAVVNG